MIARVSIDQFREYTDDQIEQLRQFWPKAERYPEEVDADGKPTWRSGRLDGVFPTYVNLEAMCAALPWLKFTVEEICPSTIPGGLHEAIERMHARLDRLVDSQLFNERCNVHVGGSTLMAVDTVIVECDLCTERLQELLDAGWRIVACCVQPDGRRPDYVLGRKSEVAA